MVSIGPRRQHPHRNLVDLPKELSVLAWLQQHGQKDGVVQLRAEEGSGGVPHLNE